jgi:hypothetical protein
MDGTGNHPVKWNNKPEWEWQISYGLSYMWNLELKEKKDMAIKSEG